MKNWKNIQKYSSKNFFKKEIKENNLLNILKSNLFKNIENINNSLSNIIKENIYLIKNEENRKEIIEKSNNLLLNIINNKDIYVNKYTIIGIK